MLIKSYSMIWLTHSTFNLYKLFLIPLVRIPKKGWYHCWDLRIFEIVFYNHEIVMIEEGE